MIDEFRGEYEFLSNFYPSEVVLDGTTYPTVEHAYQAAKTIDLAERMRVQMCATPGKAKREGRRVTLRPDWEDVKIDVMRVLLYQKFCRPSLCYKLLDTGNEELVEGNYWNDTFWGVCRGVGRNELGKLLMEVREYYKQKVGDFYPESAEEC